LYHLNEWLRANRLSLNINKTAYILFTKRPNQKPVNFKIKIGQSEIQRKESTKFLGITIDSNLSWKQHISYIKGKLKSANYIINNVKKFIPKQSLLTLYHSLIQPHIEYGLILWGGANKNIMNELTLLQKKAIRIINKQKPFEHTSPLFKHSNVLKLSDLYHYNVAQFMFKFYHNLLPKSLNKLFTVHKTYHQYQI